MRAVPLAALAVAVSGSLALPAAPASARPEISAPSAIVVDANDGHVLYSRAARSRRAIASATKLMTALVSLEELPLRRRLRAAPYQAGAAESRIDLRPGERMAVGDLLRALLLESANDAAVTLARGARGSVERFVNRMNQRARALGLRETRFANPIGLDQTGNHSSALDLSQLTRRLFGNETFAAIVDLPAARLVTGSRQRLIPNRNDLVAKVGWIDGVKTGHTLDAGYVLVGSGTRKRVRLISVVLGAPSEARRDADTLALLDYGFSLYRRVRPVKANATITRAKVAFHGDQAPLAARQDVSLTVRRGQTVRTVVRAPEELHGPIEGGVAVGQVIVLREGRRVRAVPLVTAEPVPGAGIFRRLSDYLTRPGIVLLIAGVVAFVALSVRRGRRLATARSR